MLRITNLGPGDLWQVPEPPEDDDLDGLAMNIEEAEDRIKLAKQAIEMGDYLAAQSLMTEAAGWLREES